MKIIAATSNKGKIKEITSFFETIEVVPFSEIVGYIDIEENGKTFKDNAIIKAETIYDKIPGSIVLADDSGISVPVLGGIPGIYSARFAGENAGDKDNLSKLINELKKNNIRKTYAYYTAAVALATPYGTFTSHGFMRGFVIDEARGDKGFGYDPMFIPKGYDLTLGELDEEVKKSFSHRTKALNLIKLILNTIYKKI